MVINQLDFPKSQFLQDETVKRQIVLHHTASPWNSISGDVDWWKKTIERVATHFLIGYDGQIYQLYDLKHWAYHMDLASKGNAIPRELRNFEYSKKVNMQSVGIELDCAGALTFRNGRYATWYGGRVEEIDVCRLRKPFRGTSFFHRYSDAQLTALRQLLLHLCEDLQIPTEIKNVESIFEINENAYKMVTGIYTHAAYQMNKNDAYPDPRLLNLLKNIIL